MKKIDLTQVFLALQILPDLLPTTEPIGPLNRQSLIKLNTTISLPFMSFEGYFPYRYIYHRAAALFYFVIKDHCFENGNKRSAVVITMVFLVLNKKMLIMYPEELYDLACEVAESEAADKDKEIERIKQIFKKAIDDYSVDD